MRNEILFEEKGCFVCLNKGPSALQCRKSFKHFKCGGKHHIVVCTFKHHHKTRWNGQNLSTILNTAQKNYVLFQTATTKSHLLPNNFCRKLRIFFNTIFQGSYINPEARNELHLETLSKNYINVIKMISKKKKKRKEMKLEIWSILQ